MAHAPELVESFKNQPAGPDRRVGEGSLNSLLFRLRRPVVEFLIVVIGIVAALSLDNWNNERIDKGREIDYLNRLLNDIESDISSFARTSQAVIEKKQDLELISGFARNQEGLEDSIVALVEALINSNRLGFSIPRGKATTFADLTNTGNIGLIRRAELRQNVLDYYQQRASSIRRIEKRMTEYPKLAYGIIPPGLPSYRIVPVSLAADVDLSDDSVERIVAELQNPQFFLHLNAEQNYSSFLEGIMEDLGAHAEQLRDALRSELSH